MEDSTVGRANSGAVPTRGCDSLLKRKATFSRGGDCFESLKTGAPDPNRCALAFETASEQKIPPPGFVRVGAASALCTIVQELGADPYEIISRMGVAPSLLEQPQSVIRVSVLGDILAQCAMLTSCPHLGIAIGARATVASLGLVGSLMRSCETMGEAVRALAMHLSVQDRGTIVRVERSAEIVVLSYQVYGCGGRGGRIIAESVLATTVSLIRQLCNSDWVPSEVLVALRAPEGANGYRSFFKAPVRFDQEITGLVFPASFLNVRLSAADPRRKVAFEQKLQELKRLKQTNLVEELRRSLCKRLATGDCSSDELARRLSVNRRTMSRHLRASGISFRTILDELKFEVARQLVADTELPLAQISAALNFSEPAAFTRAFARWSGGVPPHKWRHLEGVSGPHRTAT
jgi:AraC-like DNA-binding protein